MVESEELDMSNWPVGVAYWNDWEPDEESILVNRERLIQRIQEMSNAPRYNGRHLTKQQAIDLVNQQGEF